MISNNTTLIPNHGDVSPGFAEESSPSVFNVKDLLSNIFQKVVSSNPLSISTLRQVSKLWHEIAIDPKLTSSGLNRLFLETPQRPACGRLAGLNQEDVVVEHEGRLKFFKLYDTKPWRTDYIFDFDHGRPPIYQDTDIALDVNSGQAAWNYVDGDSIRIGFSYFGSKTLIVRIPNVKITNCNQVLFSKGHLIALFNDRKILAKYNEDTKLWSVIHEFQDDYPLLASEGAFLAIRDKDKVFVWNVQNSDSPLWELPISSVSHLAVKQNKCIVISDAIKLYDLKSGRLTQTISHSPNNEPLKCFDIAGDYLVALACFSKKLKFWHWPSQELIKIQELKEMPAKILLAVDPKTMHFHIACEVFQKAIKLWSSDSTV